MKKHRKNTGKKANSLGISYTSQMHIIDPPKTTQISPKPVQQQTYTNTGQERPTTERKLPLFFFKKSRGPMRSSAELIVEIWLDVRNKLTALTKVQITNRDLLAEWKHMHFWNLQVKDYRNKSAAKKKMKIWRKYRCPSNYIPICINFKQPQCPWFSTNISAAFFDTHGVSGYVTTENFSNQSCLELS